MTELEFIEIILSILKVVGWSSIAFGLFALVDLYFLKVRTDKVINKINIEEIPEELHEKHISFNKLYMSAVESAISMIGLSGILLVLIELCQRIMI